MKRSIFCVVTILGMYAGAVNAAIPITATATPSNVWGVKTLLTAQASNPGGMVRYTWSVISGPQDAEVGFYPAYYNGSEMAYELTALFPKAGTYKITVIIQSINGQTGRDTVTVTVNRNGNNIVMFPPAATVNFQGSRFFTAVQYDQFGVKMENQPAFNWSISPAQNVSITSSGKVTSTSNTEGTWTVTATHPNRPNLKGTATFSVVDSVRKIQNARAKIKHVIIIMQENRSFDHFFGKFRPGNNQHIDTIPDDVWCLRNGVAYMPGNMESPSKRDANYGHVGTDAQYIIGDPATRPWPPTEIRLSPWKFCETSKDNPGQDNAEEILAHHPESHIPAYHQLAKNFVLQDHLFAPCPSFSKPTHMYLYSGWSVWKPDNHYETWIGDENRFPELAGELTHDYPWNSIGGLLGSSTCHNTDWAIYQGVGWTKSDFMCGQFEWGNSSESNMAHYWALLKDFTDAQSYYGYHNTFEFIYNLAVFGESSIPRVSWIIPDGEVSDHPNWSGVNNGHAYVVTILDRIMNAPDLWNSCAVFLSWDDWGGFYDHVVPPKTSDGFGYGIRVPGLLISPYAKQNFVDQQTLSFDAYLRFIEDLFCDCTRIPYESQNQMEGVKRPEQRENDPKLGNLLYEFDFRNNVQPISDLPCGY